ncbi:single-stranded DNA-binding protein [Pseudomonas segetis]
MSNTRPLKVVFEIHDTQVHERSGTSAQNKPWKIREQDAWVTIGEAPYPQRTKIRVEEGQPGYAKGQYQLREDSFFIGKFESFMISPRLELINPGKPQAVAS